MTIAVPADVKNQISDLSCYDCRSQLLRRVFTNVGKTPPLTILRCHLGCRYVGVAHQSFKREVMRFDLNHSMKVH